MCMCLAFGSPTKRPQWKKPPKGRTGSMCRLQGSAGLQRICRIALWRPYCNPTSLRQCKRLYTHRVKDTRERWSIGYQYSSTQAEENARDYDTQPQIERETSKSLKYWAPACTRITFQSVAPFRLDLHSLPSAGAHEGR